MKRSRAKVTTAEITTRGTKPAKPFLRVEVELSKKLLVSLLKQLERKSR
jgi:hypothetical protein